MQRSLKRPVAKAKRLSFAAQASSSRLSRWTRTRFRTAAVRHRPAAWGRLAHCQRFPLRGRLRCCRRLRRWSRPTRALGMRLRPRVCLLGLLLPLSLLFPSPALAPPAMARGRHHCCCRCCRRRHFSPRPRRFLLRAAVRQHLQRLCQPDPGCHKDKMMACTHRVEKSQQPISVK